MEKFCLLVVDIDSIKPQQVYTILQANGCQVKSLSVNHLKDLITQSSLVTTETVFVDDNEAKTTHSPLLDIGQYDKGLAEKTGIFLLDHLADTINMCDLSREMNTNRNKLSCVFKAYFGVAVFSWFRHQRMLAAANLLTNSEQNIDAVSYAVGYADANNFSTCFKKAFGCPPLKYRKQMRQTKKLLSQAKEKG